MKKETEAQRIRRECRETRARLIRGEITPAVAAEIGHLSDTETRSALGEVRYRESRGEKPDMPEVYGDAVLTLTDSARRLSLAGHDKRNS